MLTLENYWTAYGGVTQRLAWNGQQPTPNAGVFFTNAAAVDGYVRSPLRAKPNPPPSPFSHAPVHVPQLAYIKHVITRTNTYTNVSYVDDPTIFAWEVMNE